MLRKALSRFAQKLCSTVVQQAAPLSSATPTEAVLAVQRVAAGFYPAHVQQPLWSVILTQQMHTSSCIAAVAAVQQPQHYLQLDRLSTAPGSRKLVSSQLSDSCCLL